MSLHICLTFPALPSFACPHSSSWHDVERTSQRSCLTASERTAEPAGAWVCLRRPLCLMVVWARPPCADGFPGHRLALRWKENVSVAKTLEGIWLQTKVPFRSDRSPLCPMRAGVLPTKCSGAGSQGPGGSQSADTNVRSLGWPGLQHGWGGTLNPLKAAALLLLGIPKAGGSWLPWTRLPLCPLSPPSRMKYLSSNALSKRGALTSLRAGLPAWETRQTCLKYLVMITKAKTSDSEIIAALGFRGEKDQ